MGRIWGGEGYGACLHNLSLSFQSYNDSFNELQFWRNRSIYEELGANKKTAGGIRLDQTELQSTEN